MSLTERHRSAIYQGLIAVVEDPEAVEAMLSQFPTRELDEPVTRDVLRAELADSDRRIETRMTATADDLRAELAEGERRTETRMTAVADGLRAEIHAAMRWTITTMIALTAMIIAVMNAVI